MEIRIKIDPDRITLNDMIGFEGTPSVSFVRDFLAKFVVDEFQNYIDVEQARDIVGNMTVAQLSKVADEIKAQIEGLRDSIANPTKDAA